MFVIIDNNTQHIEREEKKEEFTTELKRSLTRSFTEEEKYRREETHTEGTELPQRAQSID